MWRISILLLRVSVFKLCNITTRCCSILFGLCANAMRENRRANRPNCTHVSFVSFETIARCSRMETAATQKHTTTTTTVIIVARVRTRPSQECIHKIFIRTCQHRQRRSSEDLMAKQKKPLPLSSNKKENGNYLPNRSMFMESLRVCLPPRADVNVLCL